jgi:hypothetical protein
MRILGVDLEKISRQSELMKVWDLFGLYRA